ncbi:uncharacterized protein ARMOST_16862 [Armillaria ostoyae]|uniref:RuvB-like helicase n=1 Tax=Armillaria ostoyae TaxID=47428 RepID=A0A284RXG2_ARMOS|nr:uncharacterized protein ARMOST_16862 [Armillaria ostoyae]
MTIMRGTAHLCTGNANHNRDVGTPGYHQEMERASFAYPRTGTRRPIRAKGSQGKARQAKARNAAEDDAGRTDSRTSDVICWTSINGNDRYCIGLNSFNARKVHAVSLHEIDIIKSRTQGYLALFTGDAGEIKSELQTPRSWNSTRKVRPRSFLVYVRFLHRDVCVNKRIMQVFFIDEVHMLDIDCFSFLNHVLEHYLPPLVVMASNRRVARIRGTTFRSPHGVLMDVLDCILIISTKPYSEDIEQIIQIWCQQEDVTLTAYATSVVISTAMQTTLRYSLNLISCALMLARKRTVEQAVGVEDLQRAYTYFQDEKRSVQWWKKQQGSLDNSPSHSRLGR